jgi:hypothetical protein
MSALIRSQLHCIVSFFIYHIDMMSYSQEIMSLNESLEQLTAASDLPPAQMERMLKQLTTLESHLYRNNKRLGEMRDSVARALAIFGMRRMLTTLSHPIIVVIPFFRLRPGGSIAVAKKLVDHCTPLRGGVDRICGGDDQTESPSATMHHSGVDRCSPSELMCVILKIEWTRGGL